MERCPSVINRFQPEYGDDPDELLREYARILEQCGQDILSGNFKDFPKLKKLVLAEQTEKNALVESDRAARNGGIITGP